MVLVPVPIWLVLSPWYFNMLCIMASAKCVSDLNPFGQHLWPVEARDRE